MNLLDMESKVDKTKFIDDSNVESIGDSQTTELIEEESSDSDEDCFMKFTYF